MFGRTHIERHKGGKIFIEGDGKTTEHNGAVYQLYDNDNTARLLYVKKIKNGHLGSGDGVLTIPSTVKSLFKSYTVVGRATARYKKGTEIITIRTGWKVDRRRKDGGYYTGGSYTYESEKVKDINTFEFIDKNKVKEVHFPETWRDEDIPSLSFFEHLEKVTIPNSVTKIYRYTFEGCSGLTSVTIGKSVTKIEKNAFDNCKALTTINFNATNCTYMGSATGPVFAGCFSLTTLNIGDNVKNIPDYAFYGCSGLTSVTIPNSVTSIGSSAFSGCTGLTAVYYTGSIAQWCSIRGNFFGSAHNLYIDNNLVTNLVIPETITEIYYAFSGCTGLTEINIPDSVTKIGNDAFFGCTGLTEINIPDSVTEIGNSAFYGCTGLTEINIPDSVTEIGNSAFSGCSGLTGTLTIPNSVTNIGSYAFYNCSGLTSVTIPNSVTSIGDYAFQGCTGLTSVTIPNSVTSIGKYAFLDCTGLTSVTIPNSVTRIFQGVFAGCSGLTSIVIPNSVTIIGDYAFSSCSSLTSITIPNSVSSIGHAAFRSCRGLTSVTIPISITSISNRAFEGCVSLEEFTIPSSVTVIYQETFNDCFNLKTVNVIGDEESEPIRKLPSWVKINYLGKKLANKTENPVAKQEAKPADSDTTQAKEMPNAETPKAESKPAKTETKEETPKPAAKPATSDKVGLTVGSLAEAFKNQFGAVLRIYNGRSKADDGMSLQEVGLKQEINTTFDGKQTVGAFVEQMANAGLKVKVYTCDEWVAVLDGLTLEQAGKVKKSATKADMEKML